MTIGTANAIMIQILTAGDGYLSENDTEESAVSYDLMVFEKTKAPETRAEFIAWYEKQTRWEEEHDYQTITVSSPALQSWFMEMKAVFPPMNGEYAPEDDLIEKDEILEARLTDYCIGRDVIYAAFAWSVAEEAYERTRMLAQKHGVGFFDVSGGDPASADIILPDGSMLEQGPPKKKPFSLFGKNKI